MPLARLKGVSQFNMLMRSFRGNSLSSPNNDVSYLVMFYRSNFSFKCHRADNKIYSINAISFHPLYGTFSTAGSDGSFSFWDKDSKQRLKAQTSVGSPITATTFNRTGNLFAYSVCYDWSQVSEITSWFVQAMLRINYSIKGHEMNQQNSKCTIMLQSVQDLEVKPKPSKKWVYFLAKINKEKSHWVRVSPVSTIVDEMSM